MKDGWTYKKIKDVAKVFAGQGAPQGDSNYSLDGTPFVKAGNLSDLINGVSESSIQKVSEEVAKSHKLKLYKAGSVLFAKSGMSCMKGFVYTLKSDCYVVSHLAIITPYSVNSHFLNYYLRYNKPNSLIKDEAYPSISLKDIENLQIPFPPIAEQERIVAELDLLSGIIEKKKEQLKAYDQLAQSIFYSMFGDPITNEKGWEPSTIGDCCILKSGNSDANNSSLGTLPYVKVGDMNMHGNETYINTSSTFVDREENKKNIFPVGTTIFPKRGGAILTNKKRITNIEICCDLNVMGVIPNQERLHPLYIYFYFLNIDFVIFGGTGSTIPQINNHNIAPMKIAIPPLSLQQEFAQKVEAIEQQKALVQQSIEETQTMFDYTMDKYFG